MLCEILPSNVPIVQNHSLKSVALKKRFCILYLALLNPLLKILNLIHSMLIYFQRKYIAQSLSIERDKTKSNENGNFASFH
jgi:hypothetical protein